MMGRQVTGRRRWLALGGGLVLAVTATACNSAKEEGIEQLIERETGEDIDLDLGGDGGFSVETEDGSFSMDADGNIVIETEDGEVMTGEVDQGDGSFSMETEDGEGEFSIDAGSGEIPDDWPAEVPLPEGFSIQSGSSFSSGDDVLLSVVGESDDGAAWLASYTAVLEGAGFTETSSFNSNGDEFVTYEGNGWNVAVSASQIDPTWQVSVNVTSMPGE